VDLLAAYGVAEAGAWTARAWKLRSTNGGGEGTVDWCAGVELRARTGEDGRWKLAWRFHLRWMMELRTKETRAGSKNSWVFGGRDFKWSTKELL